MIVPDNFYLNIFELFLIFTGIFSFTIIAADAAISGPPESMDWLQSLAFRGVICEGRLVGTYTLSAYVQTLPALRPGETRVDRFSIADKVFNSSD